MKEHKEKMKRNRTVITSVLVIFFLFISVFIAAPHVSAMHMYMMSKMSVDEKRDAFISLKSSIQDELRPQVKYRCCLESPCMYCIEKTPKHGEGAACDCMKDIMEGHHPCGECMGEILEGHGNVFLAKYFASALAEEIGEDHTDALKAIIHDKYNISIEEQI